MRPRVQLLRYLDFTTLESPLPEVRRCGLPLALDQAGAYIEETGRNLGQYLTLYYTRRKDVLGRRGRLSSDYPDTVLTTWQGEKKTKNTLWANLLY